MAQIKVLKLHADGYSIEHNTTADDITFNVGIFGSTLSAAGDFAVNTNKFTVAAATGNTVVAGTADVTSDFKVNTDKFTVAAATGNTVIAGTGDVAGDFKVNTDKFTVASSTGNTVIAGTGDVAGDFKVNTDKFVVTASNGNTVAGGTLRSTSDLAVGASGSDKFAVNATTGAISAHGELAMNASGTLKKITGLADGTTTNDAVNYGQLQALQNGITWKDFVHYVTADAISEGQAASAISDADDAVWADNEYVLSATNNNIWKIYDDAGTKRLTAAIGTDGDRSEVVSTGDARYCLHDLPDESGQESSAVYAYNGANYVKIADFDWQTATGIDIASGYSAAAGDAGSIAASDTLQDAFKKVEGTHLQHVLDLASNDDAKGGDLIGVYDAGGIITATNVNDALQENRLAIDAIEDNTITSPNASISVAGTVGADNQTVDVVFSTAGAANRSIQASDLASTSDGLGGDLVGIYDAGGIITATTVSDALQENRVAIDAIEDNTVTSPNGSISAAGTIGANNQTVDVVFSTTGESNRSIQASDLAAAATADADGASLVGFKETTTGDWTSAPGDAADALDQLASRLKTVEDTDLVQSLHEAYVEGNEITTSAANGNVSIIGDQALSLGGTVRLEYANGAYLQNTAAGNLTIGVDGSVSYKLPAAQGLNGQTILNDGSGNLSWGSAGTILMTAGEAVAGSAPEAVYIKSDGKVWKAQADAIANAQCIGMAETAISAEAQGLISLPGQVIEGVLSSASPGAVYYLSAATAGALTTTAPSGSGEVVLRMGVAKSADDLLLQIGEPRVRA